MCATNVTRDQVQNLPSKDIQALRSFALQRLNLADSEHAREFWRSMVALCLSDDEWGEHLSKRERERALATVGEEKA